MTTTETQVDNLKINRLTKQQYEDITPNSNEIYLITDDIGITDSDIAAVLGYIPVKRIVVESPALTVSGGLLSWSITQDFGKNAQVSVYKKINQNYNEQFMPDSITLTSSTAVVKILATDNTSAGAYIAVIEG